MQLKEFSFCCSAREGHASPFAGLPSSSSMDPQHDFMATLRLQIAKDVSAQVSEALKEKTLTKLLDIIPMALPIGHVMMSSIQNILGTLKMITMIRMKSHTRITQTVTQVNL